MAKDQKAALEQDITEFSVPFTMSELDFALSQIKKNKSPGLDMILPEFLIYLGSYNRHYLVKLFNVILETGELPKLFKVTKMHAIKKHGKYESDAAEYRPIFIFSSYYKFLERLILNRIAQTIDTILLVVQAGFRIKRSCCEQVMSLTAFIETGFQKRLKTGAVFIDLSSAYDTV